MDGLDIPCPEFPAPGSRLALPLVGLAAVAKKPSSLKPRSLSDAATR